MATTNPNPDNYDYDPTPTVNLDNPCVKICENISPAGSWHYQRTVPEGCVCVKVSYK